MIDLRQAHLEARKRWGARGLVADAGQPSADPDSGAIVRRYRVGRITLGTAFEVIASGDTWEDTFAAADKSTNRGEPT